MIAYNPRTGKEIWQAEGIEGNSVHTPVFGHGMVFVSTGYPKKKTMAIRLDPTALEFFVYQGDRLGDPLDLALNRIEEHVPLPDVSINVFQAVIVHVPATVIRFPAALVLFPAALVRLESAVDRSQQLLIRHAITLPRHQRVVKKFSPV